MKKIITLSALALVLGVSSQAMAQNTTAAPAAPAAGYTGPTIAPMSVADVKKLGDDAAVVMVGKIEKSLGGEKYNFADATGSVVVEIDEEDLKGMTINAADTVEIHGEVDKDFTKFEIDVDKVVKK